MTQGAHGKGPQEPSRAPGQRRARERRERLGTPEQLDRTVALTKARGWLALVALLGLVSAVIAWSVVGEVTTYVRADGIVVNRGGAVVEVVAGSSGTLSAVHVAPGDTLDAGDPVAETTVAEIVERHAGAKAAARQQRQRVASIEAEAAQESRVVEASLDRQRARLEHLERTGEALVETAEARLVDTEALRARGVVSKTAVEAAARDLDAARQSLFEVMRRRDAQETEEIRRRSATRRRIAEARDVAEDADRRVKELEAGIEVWTIRSPVRGRVIEVKVQAGTTVEAGTPVASVGTGGEGLDVLVYIAPRDGKRVRSGMPALVTPSTVRREAAGAIRATVEERSEFPASLSGMVAVLGNADLARTFSRRGPPYPGRIALVADAESPSGLAWTSLRGAETAITPGTLASVEIEVARVAPIALLVPGLRETGAR